VSKFVNGGSLSGLRLTVIHHEPLHRGLHLAVISPKDAETLGVSGRTGTGWVFVEITNATHNGTAYARLDVSEEIVPGTIGLQSYIAHNCSSKYGDVVEVTEWNAETKAQTAEAIVVKELPPQRLVYADEFDQVHERLIGSRLPVLRGHQFASVAIRNVEPTFEVVATSPDGLPVQCGAQTAFKLVDTELINSEATLSSVAFQDIGGLEEAIRKVVEMVLLPAEHPEVFEQLGIRPPKGILLYGPPGIGKTLLARAIANAIKARFFFINGPEILAKFYGESERRLRDLFAEATKAAPSVVFLDELDALAPARERVSGDLEVRIVSQLLTLMDGLSDRGQVVVLAATNRVGAIDPALRRPGRFDREIEIRPPTPDERQAILRVHTRKMPLASDIDLMEIANRTVGYVGADLAALCQEAALAAMRRTFYFRNEHWSSTGEQQLLVKREDFEEGFRQVQPSAFRELDRPEGMAGWEELIGLDTVKEALSEMIEWRLYHSERLQHFAITSVQSCLLLGAARTGKTSLVTALTQQLNISLVYVRSNAFIHQEGRDVERILHQAFRKARQTSPSLLVIDNFEQVFSRMDTDRDLLYHILSQLQYELGEVQHSAQTFLIVVARTDRQDVTALLERNQVFSTIVHIPKPSTGDIEQAIRNKISHVLEPGVSVEEIARALVGATVGEVLQVCEEAGRMALRECFDAQFISGTQIWRAIEQFRPVVEDVND
jgi:transitional endoplasmic reticulum ATPase